MRAATIAVFRMMLPEKTGVSGDAITSKIHDSIQNVKEGLKHEKKHGCNLKSASPNWRKAGRRIGGICIARKPLDEINENPLFP